MRILKNILAGWVVIIFIASLFLFTPVYLVYFLLFTKERARKTYWLNRLWAQLLLFCGGIRIKCHPPKYDFYEGNCIFVTNHRSLLDILVCNAFLPVAFQFLAKKELTGIPIFGYIIRKVTLQVDRKSNQSKKTSFEALREIIKAGESVLLFPEGTRNNSDDLLHPFLNGAFKLAFETNVPVVVLTIWNTSLYYNSSFQLTPGKLDLFISDPLFPGQFSNFADLKTKSASIMLQNIENLESKKKINYKYQFD